MSGVVSLDNGDTHVGMLVHTHGLETYLIKTLQGTPVTKHAVASRLKMAYRHTLLSGFLAREESCIEA